MMRREDNHRDTEGTEKKTIFPLRVLRVSVVRKTRNGSSLTWEKYD